MKPQEAIKRAEKAISSPFRFNRHSGWKYMDEGKEVWVGWLLNVTRQRVYRRRIEIARALLNKPRLNLSPLVYLDANKWKQHVIQP